MLDPAVPRMRGLRSTQGTFPRLPLGRKRMFFAAASQASQRREDMPDVSCLTSSSGHYISSGVRKVPWFRLSPSLNRTLGPAARSPCRHWAAKRLLPPEPAHCFRSLGPSARPDSRLPMLASVHNALVSSDGRDDPLKVAAPPRIGRLRGRRYSRRLPPRLPRLAQAPPRQTTRPVQRHRSVPGPGLLMAGKPTSELQLKF